MTTARDELRGIVGKVLVNATSYPTVISTHVLGRDMGPLIDRTVDALMRAGYVKQSPPRFMCENCGKSTDDADDKHWACSLCGCDAYEPFTPVATHG